MPLVFINALSRLFAILLVSSLLISVEAFADGDKNIIPEAKPQLPIASQSTDGGRGVVTAARRLAKQKNVGANYGDKNITAIAAGDFHSFAIDNDGKVYATGDNEYGQLGLGDSGEGTKRNELAKVSSLKSKTIVAIAAGNKYSFALANDGKVYATGSNKYGQLGLGNSGEGTNRAVFAEVSSLSGKKIIAIAAGNNHSIAMTIDGKVYAAGRNEYGQLGVGDKRDRYQFTEVNSLSGKKIIAIAAGYDRSLVLDESGKLYSAGYGSAGVFSEVTLPDGANIAAIAAGGGHFLALDIDGTVYARGTNKYGQLGLGDTTDRDRFTEVSSLERKKIIAIAAGYCHSFAIDSGGKVYATGWNNGGQLGLGDIGQDTNRAVFTEVSSLSGKKIIAIAAGDKHSLALDKDGKSYATGWNGSGQLGLSDTEARAVFSLISWLGGKRIVPMPAIQLADEYGKQITPIFAGDDHSFAIDSEGMVYAAGRNNDGKLGLGNGYSYGVFIGVLSLSGKTIIAMAAGDDHSLALTNDGRVYATGENAHGQLGLDDNTYCRYIFTEVASLRARGKRIIAIAAGANHSLVLDSDGRVYAAGSNEHGQLGLDYRTNRNVFIEVSSLNGKTIVAIAAGFLRSFAIDSDGRVYGAGWNENAQAGLGDRNNRYVFTEVSSLSGKQIVAMSTGYNHSLALASDGKVYATGDNEYGQLGLGNANLFSEFTEVSSLSGKKIIAIEAGYNHSLALASDGKVYGAGSNGSGQLGLGDSGKGTERYVFTEVSSLSGKTIVAIAAGNAYSFAIDSDGKVYVAGNNSFGELGLGYNTDPATVSSWVSYTSLLPIGPNKFTEVSSLERRNIIPIIAAPANPIAPSLANNNINATAIAAPVRSIASRSADGDINITTIVVPLRPISSQSANKDGDKNITTIAAGRYHSLAFDNDGKVYATGQNRYGQLGLGDSEYGIGRDELTEVSSLSGKKITAIAAGGEHSLALDKDGKVYAAGYNYNGQLGLGDSREGTNRAFFTEVSSLSGKKIIAIAAGASHSLAMTSDGKVYAAGYNHYGQLGLGDTIDRARFTEVSSLSGKKITAIAAGGEHSLALAKDGKVYKADGVFYEVTLPDGADIAAIAAGGGHFLALDIDGTVYARGYNKYGQLGLGDSGEGTYRNQFTEVSSLSGKKIIAIFAGDEHSFAIAKDGKAYATGRNQYSQLGFGDANDRNVFTEILSLKGKNIVAMVAGYEHSFAFGSDGKAYAVGRGEYGQLGLSHIKPRNVFTEIAWLDDKRIIPMAVSTPSTGEYGKKINPIVSSGGDSFVIDSDGKVYAAGNNYFGGLGVGNTSPSDEFIEVLSLKHKKIVAMTTHDNYSFALDIYGKVYAAGYNEYGQLGLGDSGERTNRARFTEVSSLSGKKIIAIDHSFAIDEDGKVYATGWNGYGRLGLGDSGRKTYRKVFTEVSSLSGKKIVAIAAGDYHTIAIDSYGKLYATGHNRFGELGLGDSGDGTHRNVFTEVSSLSGKKIVAIAAGDYHSIAIDSDGKVYAAGRNQDGQLGVGDRGDGTKRNIFTEVSSLSGKKIVAIVAGIRSVKALTNDGKVYATGSNLSDKFTEVPSSKGKKIVAISYPYVLADNGRVYMFGKKVSSLVDKNITPVITVPLHPDPSKSDDGKKIAAIVAGYRYSLAVDSDGKVYSAGKNNYGQLGLGDKTDRDLFTGAFSLSDKKIAAIAAGGNHSIALDEDGKIYAAGENDYGQLGLGDIAHRNTFNEIEILSSKGGKITSIAAGFSHSLALAKDGKVYAAGYNYNGQLGVGDSGKGTERKVFTEVSSLSDKNITAIAAGDKHSLALDGEGKVYATGSNGSGQLGLGDSGKDTSRAVFTEVTSLGGKKITAIAATDEHSLALTSDGKVYAAGDNEYGQLGLGDSGKGTNRKVFTEVTSLSGKKIIAIVAGDPHAFALDNKGQVYAAGYGGYGNLGLGDTFDITYNGFFVEVKF
jgi:alpha-tubulin suppressor-like RCC1 family protein